MSTTEKIFELHCSSCGRVFLMAGPVESVPCDLCLDCFVEKYGEPTDEWTESAENEPDEWADWPLDETETEDAEC